MGKVLWQGCAVPRDKRRMHEEGVSGNARIKVFISIYWRLKAGIECQYLYLLLSIRTLHPFSPLIQPALRSTRDLRSLPLLRSTPPFMK